VKPFFERYPLRFSCTQCGKCCMTGGDYHVFLTASEAQKICSHLQLSRGWFRRRYLRRLEAGELVLASGKGDRCIFLSAEGRCRVYPVRPLQCRTYPFWPELAGNARAWSSEMRRCEGINQGEVVPIATIRQKVKACREQQS
jgi:Fe-S-cluster containining protein